MKLTLTCALVCLVILPAVCSAAPVPGAECVLENASVRLVLRDHRVVSLYDKVRSVEHASPPAGSTPGMFSLQLVKGLQPTLALDATQMVSRIARHTANELEMEFKHVQATVRLQVSLPVSTGEIQWSISATPAENNLCVGSVAYPVFETPASENGTIKNALLPFYEGRLHPLNRSINPWLPKVYPGLLFSQMVGCLGLKGGFLLWTDDATPNVKEFAYTSSDIGSRFSIIHRMPYQPGEWRASYHARISFSGPTWYDAADIYRNWATQQYWCATTFKARKDVPEFLRGPAYHCNLQLGKMSDEEILQVPKRLSDFRDLIGTPVYLRGTFWEKRGGWIGIDYFPPSIGEAKLLALANDLKARNIKLICEVTGYAWQTGERGTILTQINKLNEGETKAQIEDIKAYFNKHDGPNLIEQGADGRKPSGITRLCRGTALGRRFIQETTSRLFDLGVTAYHHDSDPGPMPDGVGGCFNSAHGHPIPCGPWSTDITRSALREVQAEAKRRGIRDFLITKEHCTEQLNQEVHGYISRLSEMYSDPYVIPLTQYLYHEYIPVLLYNGQMDELNDIILLGQLPGGRIFTSIPPVLADYYASMNVYSRDFLLYGRMLRPLIPGIPLSKKFLPGENQPNRATTEISVPLVRQSAWADGSGSIGVFAINAQAKGMTVLVPAPLGGPWQVTFYLGKSAQSTKEVISGESLTWKLPPGRLAAVVFRPTKVAS